MPAPAGPRRGGGDGYRDPQALPRRLEAALRLAALGCVALIAALSLLPAAEMVRTGVGGHTEHAATYAGTALLARLGFRGHGPGRIAAALVAYAGLLELLQHLSPGRHPGLDGWLAGSVGVLAGIGLAHLALVLRAGSPGEGAGMRAGGAE